jgi:hypothetical protein
MRGLGSGSGLLLAGIFKGDEVGLSLSLGAGESHLAGVPTSPKLLCSARNLLILPEEQQMY